MYCIARTDDVEAVQRLHSAIFPDDEWENADAYWLVYNEYGAHVGFCCARLTDKGKSLFLSRAGVRSTCRGNDIQKRMIRVRERWGRKQGATHAITYTVLDNYPSIVSLIKCGYRFYPPDWRWAGSGVNYFYKKL